MHDFTWRTQLGVYSTAAGDFIPDTGDETIVDLYRDTTSPLVLADKAYLRQTLIFYGLPLGEAIKTRLDKIRDIQAEYAPQLAELQEAKSGAEMRDDAGDVAEIKAEYTALLQEMNQRIQEVPSD